MQDDSKTEIQWGALTPEEWAEENRIGRTSVFAEIGAGRLIARKFGTRTLIFRADNTDWHRKLPKVIPTEKPAA
jgi:hypothetical protein